jgi:hypothetical protein
MLKSFGLGMGLMLGGILAFYLYNHNYLSPSTKVEATQAASASEMRNWSLAIWDGTYEGSAPELSRLLAGIAVYNTHINTGRTLETVFTQMLEYVPETSHQKVIGKKLIRTEKAMRTPLWGGLGVFGDAPSFSVIQVMVAKLNEAREDFSKILPNDKKHLACVDKFYPAIKKIEGYVGARIGVEESRENFHKLHLASGRMLVYTDEDGMRFYCPKKKR